MAAVQVEPGILSDIQEMNDSRRQSAVADAVEAEGEADDIGEASLSPGGGDVSVSGSARRGSNAAADGGGLESAETKRLRLRRQVSENRALIAAATEKGGMTEQKVETRAHKLDPTMFPPSMAMHKVGRLGR